MGTLEPDPEPAWSIDEGPGLRLLGRFHPLSDSLGIGLHTQVSLLRAPFIGLPLVQLEIEAEWPWLLDEQEPI